MAVIGIDLGTTYSAAAVVKDGQPEIIYLDGASTMPSVVGLKPNGKIGIGKVAKRNQAKYPQDTILEVKRRMGTDNRVHLGDKEFSAQEISAMILTKIKEIAEEELGEVTHVVISCPAYFKDPAREATKQAGEIAGLNVLRVVNEPTAAAYAYCRSQVPDEQEKLFVVYDLGGGTFDVTVIKMIGLSVEVLGTGGDPELGGGNFDDCIVDWMFEGLKETHPEFIASLNDEARRALELRLKWYAEEGKISLCNSQEENPTYKFDISNVGKFEGKPVVFDQVLTMEEFERRIEPLLRGSLQWIDEALKVPIEKHKYGEDDLTAILLVGGSTRIPLVRRLVEERFPKTDLRGREVGIDPDEIVAQGAALVAFDRDPESDEVSDGAIIDVTGHTLSVEYFNKQLQRQLLQPIIHKETPIPCEDVHEFEATEPGQSQAKIKVYQGEGIERNLEQVKLIGEFTIQFPPLQKPIGLSIGLKLDENGILVAHATEQDNGQRVECHIAYNDSARMSPEELERKKAAHQAQLEAVLGRTVNPLDGPTAPASPAAALAASLPPAQMMPPAPQTPLATSPPAAAGAPQAMVPMIRTLYDKLLMSLHKIPADRAPAVMRVLQEIDAAALAGDAEKQHGFAPTLSGLLAEFED